MESYADHPVSITEARADRNSAAKDWTPRDVLISLLRRIDNGELGGVDRLIVCWAAPTEGSSELTTGYTVATPNLNDVLGLLTRTIYRLNVTADDDA